MTSCVIEVTLCSVHLVVRSFRKVNYASPHTYATLFLSDGETKAIYGQFSRKTSSWQALALPNGDGPEQETKYDIYEKGL